MGVVLRRILTSNSRHRSGTQSGFSLLEVLFASMILLAALLGVSVLFMRSMANNVEGRESSLVSSMARSHAEELQAISLEQAAITVPSGSSELEVERFWKPDTKEWVDSAPPANEWKRTTRVQFFSVSDLRDDPVGQLPRLNNPLDGGTPVENISFRQIRVEIEGQRESSQQLGSTRNIDVTTVRSY